MAPLTQVKLAALVGVSQPRVSQVLARLSDLDAITSEADGYVGRPDRLIDAYLTAHRPAHAAHASIARAVSADFAPDLLAAWRHPTLTVVYVDRALNLSRVGFVPAEGRVDATVLVRHTSDPTLLAASEPWPSVVDGIPVVDPLQQIWDLHDLGGQDRHEAASRLRRAMLRRSLASAR